MRSELLVIPREGEGVPWAKCAAWGTAIAILVVACGGATRDGTGDGTSSHTDGGGGGGGGSGDASFASDAPHPRIKCSNVSEGGECSEGDTCDSDCSNPCQFCNFYSCSDGKWSEGEVFPLPSTDPQCTDGGKEGGVH